jgi:ABC-2 type transport system ATP-binding protein
MMKNRRPAPASIAVSGLRKSYGDKVVLDGVSLHVAEGSVFALLGPNGAGKTTVVQILSTLIAADGGRAEVAGCDVANDPAGVRAAIGVTGQFSAVDALMTGAENLRLMADLRHLGKTRSRQRVAQLLEQFDLVDAGPQSLATYSGGMTRRLDLAMTLVSTPRVIFLDEPTTGLDPRSRQVMWDIIRDLVQQGVTIFLTTQYLEEADRLADRVALLDAGRIVAEGTPADLKRLIPGGHIELRFADDEALERAARVLGQQQDTGVMPGDATVVSLPVRDAGAVATLRRAFDALDRVSIDVDAVEIHTPDLNDVFLALTGRATSTVADGPDRGASVKKGVGR